MTVVTVDPSSAIWPFRGHPYVPLGPKRGRRTVEIDPTPAYPHDAELVQATADLVAAHFPIGWSVRVFVLPFEEVGRTNGGTYVDTDYSQPKDGDGVHRAVAARIALSAKRIPIHPAMTRYVVAHEYGHVVEEWINHRRGGPLNGPAVADEYAAMRGISEPEDYGAGVWHLRAGEVMADDFRILVCKVEPEYWPHPGIQRPEFVAPLRPWWSQQLEASSAVMSEAA